MYEKTWEVGEAGTCPQTAPPQPFCSSQQQLDHCNLRRTPGVGSASGDRATAYFLSALGREGCPGGPCGWWSELGSAGGPQAVARIPTALLWLCDLR